MIILIFIHYVTSDFDGYFFEDNEHKILAGAVQGIVHVVIPSSVEIIKGGEKSTDGFAYPIIDSLESVDFNNAKDSLRIIEGYAFSSTKIEVINLSLCTKLESLGKNAFGSCYAKELYLPLNGNLSIIKTSCFQQIKVSEILLPRTVKTLSNLCFYRSTLLASFTFDQGSVAESIGITAFEATLIKTIKLPATMSSVHSTAFVWCRNLIEISVDIENAAYATEYGILYTKGYKSLVIFPPGLQSGRNHTVRDGVEELMYQSFRTSNITGITLPSSTKTLGIQVFLSCSNLKFIKMTDNVNSISTGCFLGASLCYFVLSKSVTSLPSSCFSGCTKLLNISLHSNLSIINDKCFSGCTSLTIFEIPEGVTSIASGAFQNCINLIEVWLPLSIQTLGGGIFERCHKDLKVRFRSEGKFSVDDQFIIYTDNMTNVIQLFALPQNPNIVLANNVTKISEAAFASSLIESIQLSENLTAIYSRAFANCQKLTSIKLPSSVQDVGSGIFSGSWITSVDLGKITIIPSGAFQMCRIIKIKIPSSIEEIHSSAFASSYLQEIEFDKNCSLNVIKSNAFSDCSKLSTLILPPSISKLEIEIISGNSVETLIIANGSLLVTIPYAAFMNSKRLKNIKFSNNTQILDEYSLAFCTNLENITISATITKLSDYCFLGCTSLAHIIVEEYSLLENIANSAFNGLINLETIEIKNQCKGYTSSSNNAVLYNKNMTAIVKYCCKNPSTSINISSNVTDIGWCCFEGASFLTHIIIPSSIKSIGYRSFADCYGLSEILIPDSVESVGDFAFENCCGLQCGSVKYPRVLKDDLISAGIRKEALEKCITRIFSIRTDNLESIKLAALTAFIVEDESAEKVK